jgi:hypothetical protein
VATGEGEEFEGVFEEGVGKEANPLDFVGNVGTGVEVGGGGEGVEEAWEVVEETWEVVKIELGVGGGPVVEDEPNRVEENVESGSSENEGVKVKESGTLVRDDRRIEVEGSIVMEESKGGTLLRSVGRVADEESSVKVGGSCESGSPDVGVDESNVPVLDGKTSVIVGSPVCVSTSKDVEKGVDEGKSVGVSVERYVGKWW